MDAQTLSLFKEVDLTNSKANEFISELADFKEFGTRTIQETRSDLGSAPIPCYINEFWTAKQRDASSLHEISYRACFKPQLPRFFIERLSKPGDLIYDPFMGRGTTLLEAGLLDRKACGCDVNPLCARLLAPRFCPPTLVEVEKRLGLLDLSWQCDWQSEFREDLLVFYQVDTLRELTALKSYFLNKKDLDNVDQWIRMVATNRLSGHSPGFFSVYTLPPNQAVPNVERQRKINEKRKQVPTYRDVRSLILKKSKSLLKDVGEQDRVRLAAQARSLKLLSMLSNDTREIRANSVQLVVTSPPFLETVNYTSDNWLRSWFNGIDPSTVPILKTSSIKKWQEVMQQVFVELRRVLKPGGFVAFEVGEVRGGSLNLEDLVVPAAEDARLKPLLILINKQDFTKTSQVWGVDNGTMGTNTNRIVLLQK